MKVDGGKFRKVLELLLLVLEVVPWQPIQRSSVARNHVAQDDAGEKLKKF
jgi:hypothetical protein